MQPETGYKLQVASCKLQVVDHSKSASWNENNMQPATCNMQPSTPLFFSLLLPIFLLSCKIIKVMNSYRDLEIYILAFSQAREVHYASLKLPQFELYEQGSQVRRSTKSVKDQIAEGYGRRRYKAEFIRYLVFSHASCDEATSQLEMLKELYPNIQDFSSLISEYEILGRKISSFIDYVEKNWKAW